MRTLKAVMFDVGITALALLLGAFLATKSYGCSPSAETYAERMEFAWSAHCVVVSDKIVRCVSWFDPWGFQNSTHPNGGGYLGLEYACQEGSWKTVRAWWE